MEFKLNGSTIDYDGDPELSLMTYLRDVKNIISPKDGCAPEGGRRSGIVFDDIFT